MRLGLLNSDSLRLSHLLRERSHHPSPGACEEDGPMLLGHLLWGALFGMFLAAACLVTGLSLAAAGMACVVGANVGLVASLDEPPPRQPG